MVKNHNYFYEYVIFLNNKYIYFEYVLLDFEIKVFTTSGWEDKDPLLLYKYY